MSHPLPGAESPTLTPPPVRAGARRPWLAPVAVVIAAACGLGLLAAQVAPGRAEAAPPPDPGAGAPLPDLKGTNPVSFRRFDEEKKKTPAPEIDGGVAWLNT